MTSSISTGMSKGSTVVPMAARACAPRSLRHEAAAAAPLLAEDLDGSGAADRVARVLEIVDPLPHEASLVEKVHVADVELDVVHRPAREALDGTAAIHAHPVVRRPVAVERQPLPGREPELPDPDRVVLEENGVTTATASSFAEKTPCVSISGVVLTCGEDAGDPGGDSLTPCPAVLSVAS